ncbi:MAG: hypothetical protein KQ78_01940 [Candidatus Izimaplasma bacterium HR2]|nr:MAG: hypothetical protein KQ78_01940 [Candidatus Izimaplasma bacterium HR2]
MKHYFKEGYLQDRFKNIPFKEIDEMMWDIVGAFNIIGMKTIFCCQGHKSYEYPYVIFDENISDKEIENIAYILLTCDSYKGSFNK